MTKKVQEKKLTAEQIKRIKREAMKRPNAKTDDIVRSLRLSNYSRRSITAHIARARRKIPAHLAKEVHSLAKDDPEITTDEVVEILGLGIYPRASVTAHIAIARRSN